MSLRARLKIAKEIVSLSGVIELIMGTYIGVLFGISESLRAWLFVGVLAVIAYLSTKLWIWCLSEMVEK